MLKSGLYKSENSDDDYMNRYVITMDVKETEKSYIFSLKDYDNRYGPSHIEALFSKSRKVIIVKNKGGHAIRVWSDEQFTVYPFQAGIPFYFEFVKHNT